MKFVNLRNTVSGVTEEYDEKTANKLLQHRVWSKVLVKVDTKKNLVLGEPHKVENGEKKPLKQIENKGGNK